MSAEVAELAAVEAFLGGVHETEAAVSVMQNDPHTVDEALELLKRSVHHRKALQCKFRNTQRTARTVSFVPNHLAADVQTARIVSNPPQQDFSQKYESELKDLWSLVAETQKDIVKILELLNQQERDSFPHN